MGGNDSNRGWGSRRSRQTAADAGGDAVGYGRADAVHEQPCIERHELPGEVPVGRYHTYFHARRWGADDAPLSSGGDIDWLATDEWLAYDVDVREPGPYDLTAQVAAADEFGGGTFRLDVGDDPVGRVRFDPTGGWYAWDTVETRVELPRGLQTLRVVVLEGGWKLARLRFR